MNFEIKTPSDETRKLMSEILMGKYENVDFEEKSVEKIKEITNGEYCKITTSGNNSIFIALSSVEGAVIIPDQGGWHGFKQIANFLNKKIITLKTDLGLINPKIMDDMDIPDKSALIFTSFAGYTAEQDVKSISQYCKNNGITTIEDASAGIGDDKKLLGNCKNSDIILASTGKPKMINVGIGGLLVTCNESIIQNTKIPQKLSKPNQIICGGIYEETKTLKENLQVTLNATNYLKKHISNTIHPKKRGVNVIINNKNPKEKIWKMKNELPINKSGFITKCPNYNRLKTKAICIETKNLNKNNLKKEYLDKIIQTTNNLLQDEISYQS